MACQFHLINHILKRVRAINCIADKEEIGFGIGEWSESIIFFLSCCVPKSQFQCLSALSKRWVCDVVLKDCWYIFLYARLAFFAISEGTVQRGKTKNQATYFWEVTLTVADQETRLSTSSITNHDDLL